MNDQTSHSPHSDIDTVARMILLQRAYGEDRALTRYEEEAERTTIRYRITEALIRRANKIWPAALINYRIYDDSVDLLGDLLQGGSWSSDYYGHVDLPICDTDRLIAGIAAIPDDEFKKHYTFDGDALHAVENPGREAWLKSISDVIKERVSIKALGLRARTIKVGDAKRTIIGEQGLSTLQVSECAIRDDGVSILAMDWSGPDNPNEVQVTNNFSERDLVLKRNMDSKRPLGKGMVKKAVIGKGSRFVLTAKDLTARWNLSIDYGE